MNFYILFASVIYLDLFKAIIWFIIITLKGRFPSEMINMNFFEERKLVFSADERLNM